MLKKTIKYTDFNDVEQTEDFYFHFTKAELAEMNLSYEGGLEAYIERIANTRNTPELIKLFKELILKAYGIKSDDGKRFIKSEELRDAFSQTNAYTELFMELAGDDKAAADFITKCCPKDIQENGMKAATTGLNK